MLFLDRKKMIIISIIIIFFVAADRFLKILAMNNFFGDKTSIFGDFLKLSFAKNYNIAFSLPFNGLFLNIIIVLIILALIYFFIFLLSKQRYTHTIFLLAIIFGAMSNLLDRLRYGYVIDYLDLKYFTVFNLADVMIVLGVIGLGWLILKDNKKTT